MTAPTVTAPDTGSPSLNGSWDSLPDAEPVSLPDPPKEKADKTPGPLNVEPGHCQGCGEVIVRAPGARGRMPKYHPECRPLKTTSVSEVGRSTTARRSKAEAEAEQIVAWFQGHYTKVAIMLSIVDRYDAFCMMAALPDLSSNLKGVLARYDSIRKEFMAAQSGGSILGLILTGLMLTVPIAAHHGLLGRGKAAQLLMQMPFTLIRIQQALKEGSEKLTEMMQEQLREAAEANRKRHEQATRTPENGES